MRVVIIGAGEVGTAIAEDLADEHDVVVVEKDPERAEDLTYQLDVLTLQGDGTSLETLETADTGSADLFIACTDDDRANLIACGTAKTLGTPFTIARAKSIEYLHTWERNRSAFGVDFLVCSDLLTAEDIVRVIGLPAAVDIDQFAGGLVQMAEFEISESSPVTGQTIAEADRFESLTFAGLFRDDEILIPSGETRIEAGDRAVVIGSPESVQSFALDIAPETTPGGADEIVIAGGSEIGYHTARLLEERGFSPTLVEEDESRARHLSEELPETLVMQHDATDTDFLVREHLDEADVLLAAKDPDEQNLLVAVLAKRLGINRVVAVVENLDYVDLFEEIGIDVAVNPREVTAEEIIRFSFESVAENLSVLEHDQAEVLEYELDDDSELVGTSIQELDAETDFPLVVGALTRNGAFIPPRGDTVLQAGDHIVVFVETEFVGELTCLA
ncbi:trk system potassium uptake protein TrkA [Halovenus aranensis]|uniref:Trk system potassium uptake protein TrkA n=1 Tax=Halovenus aranensis TaxID=890420 RepID=A0A1G8U7K5_9EURY|nr:Trk system potassium transporter TrkA [Halovenus aranensis]SDJ49782.1 trk system potassium uptake protein TrkA [Halovenus aranensis]